MSSSPVAAVAAVVAVVAAAAVAAAAAESLSVFAAAAGHIIYRFVSVKIFKKRKYI